MRRADRLVKMVHFLRGRRLAVTAKTIADEFEICTRTVYRDIQDLMTSGVPITGEAGIGYIIDKQYYLPPITFDIDELESIALGISMVRQWSDEAFAEKAASAFEKVRAVLPKDLLEELEQITTYSIPNMPDLPWQVSLSELRDAIRNKQKTHITYHDLSEQKSQRTIQPLALIFCGPVWLLAAWCELRKDFRNFRVDRIQEVEFLDDHFEDNEAKNLVAYRAQDEACEYMERSGEVKM